MKLAILGPNGIEDATFHVHRAGCKDVARQERQFLVDPHWILDECSHKSVIEALFDDFIGSGETWTEEGGYTTWQDYQPEVRFFPCTFGGLG